MLLQRNPLPCGSAQALGQRSFRAVLLSALAATSFATSLSFAHSQSPDADKKLKNRSLSWNPPSLDSPVKGVSPNPPCDLPAILASAGERTTAMLSNLQNFTAQESISFQTSDRQNAAQSSGSATYDYIVVFQHGGQEPLVDERRKLTHGTASAFATQSRGLPEIVLLFLPNLQPDYDMKCEGQTSWDGQPAWLVHFQQRPDRPARTFAFRTTNGTYSAHLKGRAWIAADTGEILHLESGLMQTFPEIKIFGWYLSITYAPVRFQTRDVQVWLPHIADAYYDFGEVHSIIYHTFSDFLLFSVDTDQKISKPKPPATSN